jgi:hypothetical protein
VSVTYRPIRCSVNDTRAGDVIEPPYFNVPIDPATAQAVNQAHSHKLFAGRAHHHPGDQQRVPHQGYPQAPDYLYVFYLLFSIAEPLTYFRRSPGFYGWDSLPYYRGFGFLTGEEKTSFVIVPPLSV